MVQNERGQRLQERERERETYGQCIGQWTLDNRESMCKFVNLRAEYVCIFFTNRPTNQPTNLPTPPPNHYLGDHYYYYLKPSPIGSLHNNIL